MTTMDIQNFCAELRETEIINDHRIHFYVPTINLQLEYGHDTFENKDVTTYYDTDTGEKIITVPSDIKEISTWNQWKKNLKISKHSPVYRIIKAIFDDKLIAAKDTDDEYGKRYVTDWLKGYELI